MSKARFGWRAWRTGGLSAVGVLALPVGYYFYSVNGTGRLPRAAASTAEDPVAENAACEACHVEIAAQWRGSQHRSSYTDAAFQRALAIEDKLFCNNCHAPEDPEGKRGSELQAIGVGCVTCHLAGPTVMAAPKGIGVPPPHRIARTAEFATADACAGCHAFSFGDDERRLEPLPMQDTIREHQQSSYAGDSCAECHMPRGTNGKRSHAFASTRDVESHRRALSVEVQRRGNLLLLHLDNHTGHAYPTGDLFRRVTIRAEAVAADFQVRATAVKYLARHFEIGRDVEGKPIRTEQRDDRIVDQANITIDLGPAADGLPVTWVVTLDRVLHATDHRADDAVVESQVVLSTGVASP